jgi:hypothetical protein
LQQLTPELIRAFIDQQLDRLRGLGYEVNSCLVDLGDTAEAVIARCLDARRCDCVMIGAGLRAPEQLLLFEKLINVVHARAAGARICFNTTPADTAEAVQRWVEPIAGPDARFERKPAGRGDLRRHGAGLRDGEKGIDDDLHHRLGLACVNQSADGFDVFERMREMNRDLSPRGAASQGHLDPCSRLLP